MGTTGRKWIEQWLTSVSSEGLEGDKFCEPVRRDAVMPNEDPRLPNAMLKPRNATLAPLQTQHTKRRRSQLDEIQGPLVNMHSKKPRGYDKQPRRRTREDRYEYQPANMAGRQAHQGRKPSKVRRSRKETINDRFRAFNVARNRLTLPSLAALGIFSKGKSSSPMRIRHDQSHHARNESGPAEFRDVTLKVPTLACSMTNLSVSEKISTAKRIKLEQLGTHRYHPHGQKRPDHSFEKEWKLKKDQVNWSPIKSINTNHKACMTIVKSSELREVSSPAMSFAGVNRPEDCGQKMHLPGNQDAPPFGAMLATPYTWFESNTRRPQHKYALEDILLAEAHDNLCPGTDTPNDSIDTTRRYCELNDPQKILASRKALWGEDAGGSSPITCPSSPLISRPAYTETILSKRQQIGARKMNNIIAEDLDGKDPLFQRLDKLFQEMVESEDGKFNLGLERLPAELQSLHEPRTEFDTQCLQRTKETQYDRPRLISYNRARLTDDTSASLRRTLSVVHDRSYPGKSAICDNKDLQISPLTDISNGQLMSRDSGLMEDYNSHFVAREPPTPHRLNAFPLGFWRKNKLY